MIDVGYDRHVAQVHFDFSGKNWWTRHSENQPMLQCSMARLPAWSVCMFE
jgi:hypothetical protein